MGVTYDTGALLAAERGEQRIWLRHEALLRHGVLPVAPAGVVAQAWRGGSRQARLARMLTGCDVEVFDGEQARAVGALLGKAGAADVVDGCVAEGALRRRDVVVTSDPEDLLALATALNRHLEVEHP